MRLDGLNTLSGEVDQKLADTAVRPANGSWITLRTACDAGLAEQTLDAQLELESVMALQSRLVPLVAELNTLKTEIATANDRDRRGQAGYRSPRRRTRNGA